MGRVVYGGWFSVNRKLAYGTMEGRVNIGIVFSCLFHVFFFREVEMGKKGELGGEVVWCMVCGVVCSVLWVGWVSEEVGWVAVLGSSFEQVRQFAVCLC